MPDEATARPRVAIFSRYNLREQFDLAAEFKGMLETLASRNEVYHISLKGPEEIAELPQGVTASYLPATVDRSRPKDILLKTILLYLLLPIAVMRIRRFRPDVVFLSEIIPLAALLLRLGCGCNVATAHGDWHFHNMWGGRWWSGPVLWMAEKMERVEVRTIQGVFCRATVAADRLEEWGVPENNLRVVHDAPDPAAFFPADGKALRNQCGFADADVVLLYHGVMHQGKGLDLLLTWTAGLMKEIPGIRLFMVGDGPERERLVAQAQGLGMGESVHFTGWLPTLQDVGAYCNAADICIAMRTAAESNDKIVPGALLHSMACAKVVIGPGLRGMREILDHGVNGFMFEPDNGESFQALIRELVERRADWPAIAQAALEDIQKNYSVEATARQYAAAIEHFGGIHQDGPKRGAEV